ncbi:MFS transporter [Kitasatospora sp. CB01950]|uniref:MFS transporter n=1 Tax=Kitasatospora sp. CB01950 TaxID=1703930 RepID=UPI00093CB9ED|nr:MFS transporter [Kitasatospora sp. CB01950]OKJ03357.1 MFS transporter [Kitasatospora sp. CB01950]
MHGTAHRPSPPHRPSPHRPAAHPRRRLLLGVLCLAQFMLIVDVTVINVALPAIGADLHLGRSALTWAVTAYTLCFGGLMLLGGRLADAFGARRMLTAGLVLFTAASLTAGLADGPVLLLAGRAAQGVGAALVSPAALTALTRSFDGPERTRALGVWAMLGGIGFAAGAMLGGLLTAGPGWHWVFFVNLPVGLGLLAALPALLPAAPPTGGRHVDLPGALLVTAATGALVLGLVNAGDSGWSSADVLLPLLGAAALYVLFAVVERRTAAPLLDVRVLARRPVAAGSLLMLVATVLLLGLVFLGSLYLQEVRHLSALATGALVLPMAAGTAVAAHLTGHLLARASVRAVAAGGLLLAAAGSLLLALTDGPAWTVAGLTVAAFGVVPVLVCATTTALGDASHHEAGVASGVVNTFHEVGGAIGIALVSTAAAPGIAAHTSAGFPTAHLLLAAVALLTAALAPTLIPPGRAQHPAGMHAH